MRNRVLSKTLIFFIGGIIIASVVGIEAMPLKNPAPRPGYYFIPANSSTMLYYSSSIGGIYGYSTGNDSVIVLPIYLPNLILDRNNILQDLNLTDVSFSLYTKYMGTSIFLISNVNPSSLATDRNLTAGFLNLLPGTMLSKSGNLFVSDTVDGTVFVGTLGGVERSISLSLTSGGNNFPPAKLNLSDKVSLYSKMNDTSQVESISLNSSGNNTTVSLHFGSALQLELFQSEYFALELSGGIHDAHLSASGTTATIKFSLDFQEFVQFVSQHQQLLNGLGLS